MTAMYDERYGVVLDESIIAEYNKIQGRFMKIQRKPALEEGRIYKWYGNPDFPESAVILSGLIEATKPASEDILTIERPIVPTIFSREQV